MIYTRRWWRHASVLASRSFGQGVVTALGGDVLGVWGDLDAKAVLFAGVGMAVSSFAMTMGRATVAPRRDTPPDLIAINEIVDAHFADTYRDPIYAPERKTEKKDVPESQSIPGYEPEFTLPTGFP